MKKFKLTPQLFIIFTFLVTIMVGTILLMLPIATNDFKGLAFIDAWFVATSATCVTGLSTISPGLQLSIFGQIVLACLIEIGGLSFLTIVTFIFDLFGRRIDLRGRFLLKEQLNQDSAKGITHLVRNVIIYSFIIQLVGAVCSTMVFVFGHGYGIGDGFRYGLFHSISSFNNAGFDLFVNSESSMIAFRDDWGLNIVTMLLIILGGLGFVVISDVFKKKKWRFFSLHTKIVLSTTLVLLVGGTILFKLFMWNDMSWLQAMFSSVTARTAGFATIDMELLSGPSYVLMMFLMFIGASPCSTGGGFKTTSLFILIFSLGGFINGQSPHAFKRKITSQQMEKTFALFTLEIAYLIVACMLVSMCETYANTGNDTKGLIFEVVSAFATVGLSQNITPSLCLASKIIIILTMFIGRLGPLTIVSIWNNRKNALVEKDIKYVEGNILIG